MHPSEVAHIRQQQAYNPETGEPLLTPGGEEEAHLLARIDDLRDEEMRRLGEDFIARRRRFARELHSKGLDAHELGRG